MEHKKKFCLLLGIFLTMAFLSRAYLIAMDFVYQKINPPTRIIHPRTSGDDANVSSSNTTNHLRNRAHPINIKNETEHTRSSSIIVQEEHLRGDNHTTTRNNHAGTRISSTSEEKITRLGDATKIMHKKPSCLIFMHIPKVAGSSLKVLLENITRTEGYSLEGVYSKTVRTPHSLKVNNTFIMGHFTTAMFELRPELLKCYKVTMLREPIERAISAFFFHGHQTREIDFCLGREGINKCNLNWQYKNDLTRYIAGSPKTKWNTYLEYNYNSYPMNETHISVAKEKLKKYFDLVCFTTDLMSCAKNITSTFQVNTESPSINLAFFDNRKKGVWYNKEKPRLNQTLVDKFRIANSIDSELYSWASLHYGQS